MENWANDSEFLQTFRAEAEERLGCLSEGLMALEESPGNEEIVKRLFREAHTLKGSAGMMGLVSIKELAHKVEDILSLVQKGQVNLDREATDLLLESLDRIQELLPSADLQPDPDANISDLTGRLGKLGLQGGGSDANLPIDAAEAAEAPVAQEPQVQGVVPGTESSQKKSGPTLRKVPDQPPEVASSDPAKQAELPGAPAPGQEKDRSDSTIRINIERLDKLLNLMGEILVNQADDESQVRELASIQNKTRDIRSIYGSLVEQVDRLKEGATPEEIALFSEQLNLALREASQMTDRLDAATSHFKDNSASRRLALDELQERTLHVRMLPLSTIFAIYPRVVRDASRSGGKQVRLEIRGENTELDKRILEQISDPLMHIIRNCVDHGIEAPAERTAEGKPEQGTVRLSASQRGDRVEIVIEDDGAGINPARIKRVACDKGILACEEDISDDDALELIFRPGFSTAKSVTDISGRGVGLDVVKNNIEKLEGDISLESLPGNGTRFTVSLPVTLAVISGLLIESGAAKFVIPLGQVKEMVALGEDDIQTIGAHRGFLIRENAIPLLDLLDFLGGGVTDCGKSRQQVVIVGSEKLLLGLQVGRLLGEQEVVIKPLPGFISGHSCVAGVTILGSGEVVVVLNINEIVRQVKKGIAAERSASMKSEADDNQERKSVLVVEDSLVVRELQRNILEAAGYEVHTAVDGQDAIKHLGKEAVDCVITDLEMPRMNGFDLTASIKGVEKLCRIPVVIVSSRSSDEDRRRGIEAGADAYVVKGTFDQQNLLDTIERLVA